MDDVISRAAAIDAIDSVLVEDESCKVWFKLALQNLPSAQPETHDKRTETHACDCISKTAAIDQLHQSYNLLDAEQRLEDLPSAQPERKRGKWIPVTNGRGGHECILCHSYAPSFKSGNEWLTDYCPTCGARMEGE